MAIRYERTFLDTFSDFLSIVTILICFVSKVPQIVNIVKVKNARAISVLGLTLELAR